MVKRPEDFIQEQHWAGEMSKEWTLPFFMGMGTGFISAVIMYNTLYYYFYDYVLDYFAR